MEKKEDFLSAFERTQEKGDLQLTKEEADKFKSAFEDPEFCKLMSEYVADLQNPEYRAETEAYIDQLENEDKVPEGKELIRPQKGFVAKSKKKDKNDKEESKIFINIVQSEKITKPTKTDSAKGQNWSLPYSLGPPHMEKDKKGDAVAAFDCCFHPEALSMAMRYKAFRDLLVSTAIQGIEDAYKLQNQSTSVKKDFTVLKGVTYKCGDVPTMMIDKASKENKWQAETHGTKSEIEKSNINVSADKTKKLDEKEPSAIDMVMATEEGNEEDIVGTATPKSSNTKSKPALKKGFLNNPKTAGSLYPTGSSEGSRPAVPPKPLVEELPDGYKPKPSSSSLNEPGVTKSKAPPLLTAKEIKRKVKTTPPNVPADTSRNGKEPKFTLTERGILGLGDFDGGNTTQKVKSTSNRPEELVYRIEIPLVTKTSKVELDVGEKQLKMTYMDIYDLSLDLPYPVYEKKGGAKFDKAKKLLTITLPVQPPNYDEIYAKVESKRKEDVKVLSENNFKDESAMLEPEMKAKQKGNAHSRWLNSDATIEIEKRVEELIEDKEETLAQEIARKAKEAVTKAKKDQEIEESKKNSIISNKEKDGDEALLSKECDEKVDQSEVSSSVDFISSGTYVGRKNGYAFKKGDRGMGYYIDNGAVEVKAKKIEFDIDDANTFDDIDINQSTLGVSETEMMIKNATLEECPFEFRQTKEGIAMIICVKNIIEASVNIEFHNSSLDVFFTATTPAAKNIDYASSFDCFKEIDAANCRFDVATENMVIIIKKLTEEFWINDIKDESCSRNAVITRRPYTGSTFRVKTPNSPSGTESNNIPNDSKHVENLAATTSLLNEMKFSTEGLLDLD